MKTTTRNWIITIIICIGFIWLSYNNSIDYKLQHNEDIQQYSYTTVLQTNDGRRVTCIVNTKANAMSCDWLHADGVDNMENK